MGPNTGNEGINTTQFVNTINKKTTELQDQITALSNKSSDLSIADMFTMQMKMNTLSQLTEMSTSVVSAMNSAIMSPARNIKS